MHSINCVRTRCAPTVIGSPTYYFANATILVGRAAQAIMLNMLHAAMTMKYRNPGKDRDITSSMELVSKGGGLRTISIKEPRDWKINVSPPVTNRFHNDQAEEYDLE